MAQFDEELWQAARKLAGRPYSVAVLADETTDNEPIFVALNPELSGCISQGDTIEEAINSLADARIDYIYFLIVDGLPVPQPSHAAQKITLDLSSDAWSRQHLETGSWLMHHTVHYRAA